MSNVVKLISEKIVEFLLEFSSTFLLTNAIENQSKYTRIPFRTINGCFGDIKVVSPSFVRVSFTEKNFGERKEDFKSGGDAIQFLKYQFIYNDVKAASLIPRRENRITLF